MGSPKERQKYSEKPPQPPLSENAKQVIRLARKEAIAHNHESIGTGHMLLGLLQRPTSAELLSRIGFSPDNIRIFVYSRIGYGNVPVDEDRILMTPRSVQAILFAHKEAKRDKREEITEVDLLIGLVLEGQGTAAGVLRNMLDGINTKNLIKLIKRASKSEA